MLKIIWIINNLINNNINNIWIYNFQYLIKKNIFIIILEIKNIMNLKFYFLTFFTKSYFSVNMLMLKKFQHNSTKYYIYFILSLKIYIQKSYNIQKRNKKKIIIIYFWYILYILHDYYIIRGFIYKFSIFHL